jgi:hypothetical protein
MPPPNDIWFNESFGPAAYLTSVGCAVGLSIVTFVRDEAVDHAKQYDRQMEFYKEGLKKVEKGTAKPDAAPPTEPVKKPLPSVAARVQKFASLHGRIIPRFAAAGTLFSLVGFKMWQDFGMKGTATVHHHHYGDAKPAAAVMAAAEGRALVRAANQSAVVYALCNFCSVAVHPIFGIYFTAVSSGCALISYAKKDLGLTE